MKLGQKVDPHVRLLGALIRTGDAAALRKVVGALTKHRGSMLHASVALGVSERVLYNWVDSAPELAEHVRSRHWTRPRDEEIAAIIATFKKHDGKITHTAEALGISVHTLYRLIDELPEVAKHATGTSRVAPKRRAKRKTAA